LFELQQKNETIVHKNEAIKQLQEQLETIRKAQSLDGDKLRKELVDLKDRLIKKDEALADLHTKYEELI
jgi:hypothetical protein